MLLKGKRILITGGMGFLGTHLREALHAGILLTPEHKDYDLTRQDVVEGLFDDAVPDIVIHLAAEVGGIGANQASPGRFFYANAIMGINVIEEARKRGVEKFVQIGTVCAYPKLCSVPFREKDLWAGYPEETNAPYGIAKKSLLVMLQAYRQQYGFNGIYLLPVNLYGPGDDFGLETSHVIPAMIRKMVAAHKAGEPTVTLWGTGRPTREFLYVKDCARAIVLATESYDGDEPVNLGGGNEISTASLAEKIGGIIGYDGDIAWDASKPDGQPRRRLNTSRATERFGFTAATSLDDGLRQTIDWWIQCSQDA